MNTVILSCYTLLVIQLSFTNICIMCVEQNHNSHASDHKLSQLEETVSDLKCIVNKLLKDSKSKSEEIYKLEHRVKALEIKCESDNNRVVRRPADKLNISNEGYVEQDDDRSNTLMENNTRNFDELTGEYRTTQSDEPQLADVSKLTSRLHKRKKHNIRKRWLTSKSYLDKLYRREIQINNKFCCKENIFFSKGILVKLKLIYINTIFVSTRSCN